MNKIKVIYERWDGYFILFFGNVCKIEKVFEIDEKWVEEYYYDCIIC